MLLELELMLAAYEKFLKAISLTMLSPDTHPKQLYFLRITGAYTH